MITTNTNPITRGMIEANPPGIPDYLKERPQWVAWRLEEREGKATKVPVDVWTGDRASTADLMTWASFERAYDAYRTGGKLCGVGFVFCSGDPFVGIDLDGCRDPETEEVEAWAAKIISRFPGAHVEASPSGTGVHIIARGTLDGGGKRRGSVEVYEQRRFFTVTGVAV